MFKLFKLALVIAIAALVFTVIQTIRSQDNRLTAGGKPVPQKFIERAKKAGYYCLDWAAKRGLKAPTICLPLDK